MQPRLVLRLVLLAFLLACLRSSAASAQEEEEDGDFVDEAGDEMPRAPRGPSAEEIGADAVDEDYQVPASLYEGQSTFFESFQSGMSSRWVKSKNSKYEGNWAVELTKYPIGIRGDKALVAQNLARHHGISLVLTAAEADDLDMTRAQNADKDFVAQYEVRLQNKLDCGGAYMKLLRRDAAFDPKKLSNDTPFSIMFGPDKCGGSSKVHFILQHQNPITKTWEEKHLTSAPEPKIDETSHLYTLIIRPDNTFAVLIDNEEVRAGSLTSDTDFEPSVNPPKTIDDPTDHKPADWVDEETIPDPNETKPDDWDETQPKMIKDEDATVPHDWDENEPEYVADPAAMKPADWDDEMDGDWNAPLIPNPRCNGKDAVLSGCGKYESPMIVNPLYKGKWVPPTIPNPAYKGEWKARQIPNPSYFEDKHPSRFFPIGAIAFELWTMTDKISFDNIYLGHDADAARQLGHETTVLKQKVQEAKIKAYTDGGSNDGIEGILKRGAEFMSESPMIAVGILITCLIPFITCFFMLGGSTDEANKAPAAAEEDKEEEEHDKGEKEKVATDADDETEQVSKAGAKKRGKAKKEKVDNKD